MSPLIKKTLFTSLLGLLAAALFIFIFGSIDSVPTEIAKSRAAPRFESVPTAQTIALSGENITEGVAKQIAKDIIEQNPEGPVVESDQPLIAGVNPEQLTENILSRAFQEINIEDLRPAITLEQLVVIKSEEKALAEHYFRTLNAIALKNFPAGVSINWENPALTNFDALINAYSLAMAESMKVPVPQDLAILHSQYIALLGAEKNTLTLIKNYRADPAQATVAIEAGDQFTSELESILTRMNEYIVIKQLNIAA